MPEYLSPGVYVEEIELGSRPIEGVSTSTAGIVGVTERGPEDVPVLVTSYPQFYRVFGGYLNYRNYEGAAGEGTWYLPHSIEGFFQNGGQRAYAVRVASAGAAFARIDLMDRGVPGGYASQLIARAQEGDLFLITPDLPALAGGEILRVDDGAATEYVNVGTAAQIAAVSFANQVRALRAPAYASYTGATGILTRALNNAGGALAFQDALAAAAPSGSNQVGVNNFPGGAFTALAQGQILQIGDPADPYSEYAIVESIPADPTDLTIRLRHRLAFAHPSGAIVTRMVEAGTSQAGALSQTAAGGDGLVVLSIAGAQPVIRLGGDPTVDRQSSYYVVAPVSAFALRQPTAQEHLTGESVTLLNFDAPVAPDPLVFPATTIIDPANPGDSSIRLPARGNLAAGQWIQVDGANAEFAQIASVPPAPADRVVLRQPLRLNHPAGGAVTRWRRRYVLAAAVAGDSLFLSTDFAAAIPAAGVAIQIAAPGNLAPGQWIGIGGANPEVARVATIPPTPTGLYTLVEPLRFAHAPGDGIVRQNDTTPHTTLLQVLPTNGQTVMLADNSGSFAANALIEIGAENSPERETALLGGAINPFLVPMVPPGVGVPAVHGHLSGVALSARQPLFSIRALDRGDWGNELRVKVEDEDPALGQSTVAAATPANSDVPLRSTSGIEPGSLVEILDWTTTLSAYAPVGQSSIVLASRAGLVIGDRLRLGRNDSEYVTIASLPGAGTTVVLTELLRRPHGVGEPVDRMSVTGQPRLAKVQTRIGLNLVRFDGGGLPFPLAQGWTIRTREFRLTVEQVKRGENNPRTPGEDRIENTETHRFLSLDGRHSHYAGKTVGSVNNPLRVWDRRPDGSSDLVRVDDPLFPAGGPDNTQGLNRVGPDLIYESSLAGRRRPVGRWLVGGDNNDAGVTDNTYLGQDNIDPLQRTGLQSLKNPEDISLIAIPGRVSAFLQEELINQCELMRYRMALLDSLPGGVPTGAMIPDVTAQRQQFDTKYAALYYPWLQLRDPFPDNPAQPGAISIPPSGHMIGIYARTDVTRGVQKAPANETIAGILGLQRSLTKGEQDVLNPSPVNINCLRDFRNHDRGLRVWGARIITSDFEWVYVNVRRLFNYIERSLEIGTQPYVFDPNDEHLWARIRRSISDFLNVVWRDGGLMGRKPEEAYFVKCDRTTMTQLDIDSGRLIIVVGIAPVKPAEFVVIRIGQWQGGSSVQTV